MPLKILKIIKLIPDIHTSTLKDLCLPLKSPFTFFFRDLIFCNEIPHSLNKLILLIIEKYKYKASAI